MVTWVALLWICQTEAVPQALISAAIGRQSFGGAVGHLVLDEAWVYSGPQDVLNIVLCFREDRLHRGQRGCSSCFDVRIDLFQRISCDTYLFGGFGGSIGIMNVGHYCRQFV